MCAYVCATISRQQFQSGLKTHLFKRAYTYDFYLRELSRSELTYLLTYLHDVLEFWVY